MTLRRRTLLAHALTTPAVTAPALAAPAIARAAGSDVLTIVPASDLAALDPVWTTAPVVRNHGYMVFDTRLGMNVDLLTVDWGTTVQRRNSKLPTDKGGWSAFFTNLTWTNNFDPAAHLGLRGTPAAAWFGWPTMPRMEALRSEWFEAPDLAEQKRICAEIERQFWTDVPYLPLGCPSAAPTCPPPTALP